MTKNYQTKEPLTSAGLRLALPQTVSVAMSEIVEGVQEGLLALAVGAGLQVMTAMMNADVEAVCGPKGKHNPARAGVRHGTERGSVPWAVVVFRWPGRGCVHPMARVSCRCRPMNYLPRP